MTRKHFERLAQVMRVNLPEYGTEALDLWLGVVIDLAFELEAMNPNFDRERFISACQGVDT